MSRIAILLLLLIFIGDAYFRDTFHTIWLILGSVFFAFLLVYHIVEGKRKHKKSKQESL